MSIIRNIYYTLPPQFRFLARRVYYFPVDIYEQMSGKKDPLIPPKGMIFTGSGDFKQQGEKLVTYFQEAGLKADHDVLDIGSGIGRIAIPLTNYLNESGSYEGFDVVKLGIDWCKNNISNNFPNFNFRYIALNNDLYKSDGAAAANFHFPYKNESFDFVLLTSVFTHMLPDEVENYLNEISRVLRPGGICFATFFIVNEASDKYSKENSAFHFPYDYGHYRLMDKKVKSANVAYGENYLRQRLVLDKPLELEAIHYGYWCGREKEGCKDFQDIVLLKKRS